MSDIHAVMIDPPWNETGGGKCKRGADRHYDLLKSHEMPAVIRSCEHWDFLSENAHAYMWTTNNFLRDALWLLDELDFRYVTNLVWIKNKIGLGYYLRGQHELCLFAVRGKLPPANRSTSTWVGQSVLKKRAHSQKPDEIYTLIESLSPPRYLEIFARTKREGWLQFGNEL